VHSRCGARAEPLLRVKFRQKLDHESPSTLSTKQRATLIVVQQAKRLLDEQKRTQVISPSIVP